MLTERLRLRRLRGPDDVDWLAALDTDAEVMWYIREPSAPEQARADAARRIEWDSRQHLHTGTQASRPGLGPVGDGGQSFRCGSRLGD